MALGVAGEQASGGGERAMVADGGEGVAQFASFGSGVADAVGGEQRKMQRAGDVDGGAVAGFFFAMEVALQFDVDIFGAEDADELIDLAASFVDAALLQGCGERAFVAAGEADQAFGVFFEFLCADCAFAFLGAQLHFGDQAAEVLVAGAGGDEEGKTECHHGLSFRAERGIHIPCGLLSVGFFDSASASLRAAPAPLRMTCVESDAGDFRADVRLDLGFFRGQVKARSAVDAVGVEQRHGGHA